MLNKSRNHRKTDYEHAQNRDLVGLNCEPLERYPLDLSPDNHTTILLIILQNVYKICGIFWLNDNSDGGLIN